METTCLLEFRYLGFLIAGIFVGYIAARLFSKAIFKSYFEAKRNHKKGE